MPVEAPAVAARPTPCATCGHRMEAHVKREGITYCVVCNRRVPDKGACGHPTFSPE